MSFRKRVNCCASDRLVGDEGYGPSVIKLTAIGEKCILARLESHNGDARHASDECSWTLSRRDWKLISEK